MERLPRMRRVRGSGQIKKRRERIIRERKKKAATKTKPIDRYPIIDKPLTSEQELKKTRKEINALNRRRAKDMERRVARYLKGNRVPASGAMMGMKGDCYIPLLSGGQYLIECKLSANEDRSGGACFPMSLNWFDKVLKDTQSMSAKFGILVIHYHGKKEDYVFVPNNAMSYIAARSTHGSIVDLIRNDIIPRDITTIDDRKRSTIKLFQYALEKMFVDVRGFKAAAFTMSSGVWHVFTLSQYRDLLEGV